MRRLAFFAFAASGAIFVSQYVLPVAWQLYAAVVSLVMALASVLITPAGVRRRSVLIALGLLAGFVWNWGYSRLWTASSQEIDGTTSRVVGTVDDFPVVEDYGAWVDIRVDTGSAKLKTRAYVFSHEMDTLLPGDTVEFTAEFSTADQMDGEHVTYFTSLGYKLLCSNVREIQVLSSPGFTLRYIHRYLEKGINSIIQKIFPIGTGPFMQALITGDRTLIDQDLGLTYAMERTGITHIVAVSGMHITILAGAMTALLGRRKRVIIITAPVLLLFMGISGFSASVVRAVIMQFFIMFAPLFNRENDSITSLSAALLLILLINPYAATGVGLQLSFGATLGIILFTPKMIRYFSGKFPDDKGDKKRKFWKRLYMALASSLASTLSAMVFTLPISVLYFGYISLVSPLVNLLVLWAVTPAFILGSVATAVASVWLDCGAVLAWLPALAVKFITLCAEFFSKPFFAGVYVGDAMSAVWFIWTYICLAMLILSKAGGRRILALCCASAVSLSAVLVADTLAGDIDEGFTLTALDVGQGQSLALVSGDMTALIDCGSTSGQEAGDSAEDYIRGLGRDRIDLLILTHYHEDHANGIQQMMTSFKVGALIVPVPAEDGGPLQDEVLALAKRKGIDIIYVEGTASCKMGEAEITIYGPVGGKSENEQGLFILVSQGEFDVFVTGDADTASEIQITGREELPDIECLIVGHHGSSFSTSETFLDRVKPEAAVISVGENSYGHPAPETVERLRGRGVRVYRTDLLGDVTIDSRAS